MSEQLKAFYKAYAAWLDAGAPQHEIFGRCLGLCFTLLKWADDKEYDVRSLCLELKSQFIDAGLHPCFPFNASESDYGYESKDYSIHLNPARVAWVRKHAVD